MDVNEFVDKYEHANYELSSEIRTYLQDDKLRDKIYKIIPLQTISLYHNLLKELFAEEVKYRNSENNNGSYLENLYHCAFFLFMVGDLNDVLPMWKVKNADFDFFCGFDIQFLVGAGVEKTLNYLNHSSDPEAPNALQYIESCRSALDFDDMQAWIDQKKAYFEIQE